jgi:hypothetical protein
MGLIRKTLAVSTLGVVKGSSKKQRVAKATMKSSQAAAAALQQQAALAAISARTHAVTAAAALKVAEQKAAEEREFRYATDPVFRKFVDDKNAAAEAMRQFEAARIEGAHRAELERIEEAARLRRLRNQQRAANAKKALVLTGRGVAILVVGLVVWVPQLTVGLIRRKPAAKWRYTELVRRPEPTRDQLDRPA